MIRRNVSERNKRIYSQLLISTWIVLLLEHFILPKKIEQNRIWCDSLLFRAYYSWNKNINLAAAAAALGSSQL